MPKFKICPRCELNWIKQEVELCDVCKAQLANEKDIFQEEEEELCPLCKTNYVEAGEKYCNECLEKRQRKGIVDDEDSQGSTSTIEREEGFIGFDEALEEEEGATEREDDYDDINSIDEDAFSEDTPIDLSDDDFAIDMEDEPIEEEEDQEFEVEDDFEKEFKAVKINPLDFEEDDEEDEVEIRKRKLKSKDDDDI